MKMYELDKNFNKLINSTNYDLLDVEERAGVTSWVKPAENQGLIYRYTKHNDFDNEIEYAEYKQIVDTVILEMLKEKGLVQ